MGRMRIDYKQLVKVKEHYFESGHDRYDDSREGAIRNNWDLFEKVLKRKYELSFPALDQPKQHIPKKSILMDFCDSIRAIFRANFNTKHKV